MGMTLLRKQAGILIVLLVSCTSSPRSTPDTSPPIIRTHDFLGLILEVTQSSATLSGSWVNAGTTCTGFSLEAVIFSRTRSLDDFDRGVVPVVCSVGEEQLISVEVPTSHADALEQGICLEVDQVRDDLLYCQVQRDERVSLQVLYSY